MKPVFFILGLSLGLSISFQSPSIANSSSCGTPHDAIKSSRVIWGVYISPNLIDYAKNYGCGEAFLIKKNNKQWAQIATFNNEGEAKDLANYLGGWYAEKTLWRQSNKSFSEEVVKNLPPSNSDQTIKFILPSSTIIIKPIIFKTLGELAIGLFIAIQLRKVIRKSKEEKKKQINHKTHPRRISNLPEQEIWNIVTNYGKYPEVWEIYRDSGWLEAIKCRDEKEEFDDKVSRICKGNTKYTFINKEKSTSKPVQQKIKSKYLNKTQGKPNQLDLAVIKSLVPYFEKMSDQICRYHQDNQASKEEAEIIASYYKKIAKLVETVETKEDLKALIKYIKYLKILATIRNNH